MRTLERARFTALSEPAGTHVQRVLDALPVTDFVYHHLAYTRPLVDAVVEEVQRVDGGGRVIVVGPNELLPAVLVDLGYEVELWVLEGLPLSQSLTPLAVRTGPLDEVLAIPPQRRAAVLLAPYAIEAAAADPEAVIDQLAANVEPGGHLIAAVRRPGEMLRRIRGTSRGDTLLPPSPSWPRLPARRLPTARELAAAGRGAIAVERIREVKDHRAYLRSEAMKVPRWAAKAGVSLAKSVVPSLRDCTLITYVVGQEGRPNLAR